MIYSDNDSLLNYTLNYSLQELPHYLTFNEDSIKELVIYSFLFVVAAAGNLPVFITLLRNRHRKSRIKLMLMHLAIADLIVTFIMIPLEISWRITVEWIAGNTACKVMLFLRAFGPYLSSMVLVCISLDRYFAILHPLKVNDAQRRSKIMLTFAWVISIICSIPQSIIFRVQEHPEFPQFIQCVSFNFFPTEWHQTAYNLFCLLALYGIPLFIIIYCYSRILWEISRRSRDTEEDLSEEHHRRDRLRLRRSDMTHIERARARTLRMTIIIVLAFFWCWTPYVVMVLWYMFDPNGAQEVDSQLQSALFMFAVSNSCVNPLVYGSYAINLKQLFRRCYNRTRSSMGFSRQTVVSTTIKTAHTEKDVRLTTSARGLPVTLKLQGSETIPTLLEETCTPCERQRGSFRSGRLGCSYSNHISYPKYPA
ncbi:adipokinetic hormone/corazonin-related peptide receptor variant I-like isoform X2 [Centruroides vittatus]|uniref:adipokinetic hormone/corazonin-related peptide receptor variant I-like isoform X2 n=1 Tax=Centruroides vittatus TaxID=120091 RepID=UPI00350F3233